MVILLAQPKESDLVQPKVTDLVKQKDVSWALLKESCLDFSSGKWREMSLAHS